jgi:hypothetical protein
MEKKKGNSNYRRKKAYLIKASRREGRRVWGWEFPEKPWKKKA